MKILLLLAALALPALPDTRVLTLHHTQANFPQAIPVGMSAEYALVIISTDDASIKAFKVSLNFTNQSGQQETRTQLIERASGPYVASSVATFRMDGATNVKPAVVEPLSASSSRVVSD